MLGDWSLFTSLLYVMGIILLLIEGAMPGFGIAGIGGLICIVISIMLITSNLFQALLLVIGTIVIFVVLLLLLYKLGFAEKYMKLMVLKSEKKGEDGYSGDAVSTSLIGTKGKSITALRPAGTVMIDNKRFDAITDGTYIEKDTEVEVVRIEGSSIVVKN